MALVDTWVNLAFPPYKLTIHWETEFVFSLSFCPPSLTPYVPLTFSTALTLIGGTPCSRRFYLIDYISLFSLYQQISSSFFSYLLGSVIIR